MVVAKKVILKGYVLQIQVKSQQKKTRRKGIPSEGLEDLQFTRNTGVRFIRMKRREDVGLIHAKN